MGAYSTPTKKSPPPNVAVVRRVIEEIWNQGKLDLADRLFAAIYVNSGGLIPDGIPGPEAVKLAVAIHRTAYPNLHITIERLVSEGELVAFQWVASNRPTAETSVVSLEQSREDFHGTAFCRLVAGTITESWLTWEASGLIRKLVEAAALTPGRVSLLGSGLS